MLYFLLDCWAIRTFQYSHFQALPAVQYTEYTYYLRLIQYINSAHLFFQGNCQKKIDTGQKRYLLMYLPLCNCYKKRHETLPIPHFLRGIKLPTLDSCTLLHLHTELKLVAEVFPCIHGDFYLNRMKYMYIYYLHVHICSI